MDLPAVGVKILYNIENDNKYLVSQRMAFVQLDHDFAVSVSISGCTKPNK